MKPFGEWRAEGSNDDDVRGYGHMFDECLIQLTKRGWLHLEVMNERDLFIGIGDACLNLHVYPDGTWALNLIEGATVTTEGGSLVLRGG